MGLEPLEFADCLTDSPVFRNKLHEHEKELERTSKAIKNLIYDGKELLSASKNLAKAQRQFSQNLIDFNFEVIGQQQTDDERTISTALAEFGKLMSRIEDERERMLEKATEQFIKPLENFRKQHIGQAKEGKKQFDKQTQKFCSSLDRYLSLKTKINDNTFKEADATLDLERRGFYQASMKYVLQLQEVQERKKFEFVEIVLVFMYSLLTFYHEGHETASDYSQFLNDLQLTLQKSRQGFEATKEQAESLMLKMLEARGSSLVLRDRHKLQDENFNMTHRSRSPRGHKYPDLGDSTDSTSEVWVPRFDLIPQSLSLTSMVKPLDQSGTLRGTWTRQGYLYLMEKTALATKWNKYWCCYKKDNKQFFMVPFSQHSGIKNHVGETSTLKSCTRRATDSIERRFCMDIAVEDRTGALTLQALSEEDRKLWMDVMGGKEPIYNAPKRTSDDTYLDDIGFNFVKKCLTTIEQRGLDDQGLYRVVGVSSKVTKLIALGLDKKKGDKLTLDDQMFEMKTITSAVKTYLRSLPEPLMTFRLHCDFIAAAKQESKTLRLHDIHTLVHKLPEENFEMLEIVSAHLRRVSRNSEKNLMTVANLGVCFGPTLMRPEEETVAAIMDIKFCNIVIEILVNNYEMIFKQAPEDADLRESISNSANQLKKNAPGPPVNHSTKPSPQVVSAAMTGGQKSPRQYANTTTTQNPYHMHRQRLRAVDVYNPSTGGFETQMGSNSTSDSSDSLNSSQSNHTSVSGQGPPGQDPGQGRVRSQFVTPGRGPGPGPVYSNINVSELGYQCPVEKIEFENTKLTANRLILSTSDVPTFGSIKKRRTPHDHSSSMTTSMTGGLPQSGRSSVSMTGSVSGSLGGNSLAPNPATKRRTVRSLYRCEAENETELSFEPNQIIRNVRPSKEPGWLEGSLGGKTGLLPENYVEYIDT